MKPMTVNTIVQIVQATQVINGLVQKESGHKISGHSIESLVVSLDAITSETASRKQRPEAEAFARALQSLVAAVQDLVEAPASVGVLGRSK